MIRLLRGLLVLGLVLLTSSCGLSFYNIPFDQVSGSSTYPITVVFSDASNLPRGGEAKIGQTTVGRVRDISTHDFHAYVLLDVQRQVRLPAGTGARLELTTPLGEQYIVLQPPPPSAAGARQIAAGGTIGLAQTSRGPDVENTLAALGGVLNGSGLDQAHTIVSELHTALDGREGKVRGLLQQLDSQLAVMDSHSRQFDETVTAMNQVAATTAANRSTLDSAMTEIAPAVDRLVRQRQQFESLLGHVNSLSTAANGVVGEAGPEFTREVTRLHPVVDSLAGYDKRIGGTLTALRAFQHQLGGAIPGDYLNLDGTLDVSGTLLPLITGGAPPPVPQGGPSALLSGGTR